MPKLSSRQEDVLSAIVQLYVRTAEPVSSKQLCEEVGFDCSPATIRNEMSFLEKKEYLMHPHTSAGRVPTDLGYRYFVNLKGKQDLTQKEQQNLQEEFLKLQAKYARLARITSKLLAQQGEGVGFSSIPEADVSYGSGMANLLRMSHAGGHEELTEAAEALEQLDEHSEEILSELEKRNSEIEVFIGDENPMFQMQHVSMLLSPTEFPNGERGFVALIGPKRMPYRKNISVIREIRRLLAGGGIGALFIIGVTTPFLSDIFTF